MSSLCFPRDLPSGGGESSHASRKRSRAGEQFGRAGRNRRQERAAGEQESRPGHAWEEPPATSRQITAVLALVAVGSFLELIVCLHKRQGRRLQSPARSRAKQGADGCCAIAQPDVLRTACGVQGACCTAACGGHGARCFVHCFSSQATCSYFGLPCCWPLVRDGAHGEHAMRLPRGARRV